MLDKMADEVDLDVLDQIIKLAESAMVRPFSKKKDDESSPIEAQGEADEGEMLEDGQGEEGEEELSDEELEELMESYKRG